MNNTDRAAKARQTRENNKRIKATAEWLRANGGASASMTLPVMGSITVLADGTVKRDRIFSTQKINGKDPRYA